MKYLLMTVLLFVANQSHAFMPCGRGNVYEGDSQAEVVMRCGQPFQVMSAQPIWVAESSGKQRAGRWQTMQTYIYPAGDGRVYYLKIRDNQVISIDVGAYGSIPK